MIPRTLAGLVPWIAANGYTLFFVAAIIEGALVTTAAGVVAGLGYFSLFAVIALSIAGDLVGDLGYYFLGRSGKRILHSKFFKFFGVRAERVDELKRLLHTHTGKALLLIKLSPLIGPAGLMVVGAMHVPARKFFRTVIVISVCKAFFFAVLGYCFARSYVYISGAISHGEYLLVALLAALVLVHLVYQRVTKRIAKSLEEK